MFKKIKEFFKGVLAYFKRILRLTKFDNELFKIGVDKVFEKILVAFKDIDVKVSILLSQVKLRMKEEFKKYKFITNIIDACFKWVDSIISKSKVFDKYTVEKKVLYIRDKIIKWYNDNY